VTCKYCQAPFSGAKQKKYCSVKCREASRYLRRKDKLLIQKKEYYEANKYDINRKKTIYKKEKRAKDDKYRIKGNLRSRLNKAITGNYKTGSAVADLGCSIEELKKHLESQFQPGMNWDNYGLHGWHIDHIKSLASFDLSNPDEAKKACHYTNLQPLWAEDNWSKG